MNKKSSLASSLEKIAARANRAAFKKINAKRKKMGLAPLAYNPSRNYWI
jgi:hypothetical protein